MADTFDFNQYAHGGFKTVVVASILIVMLCLMVGGRLLSRTLQRATLAADDYVLFIAAILNYGLCALAIAMPRIAGIGVRNSLVERLDPSKASTLERGYIAWMVVYGFAVAFSKIGILLLYVRVFTTRNRVFTMLCYLMGFIITATCLVNAFIAVFQCNPVRFAWDPSVPEGSCIDNLAFERYTAIPNIITGAVMLAMPMPLIWELNIAVAAKVALTATFLHGIIGFVASGARLAILFWPQSSHNVNSTAIAWTIWTINEPSNYVIAACLPTLRPIFVRILPASFFVLSKRSSSSKEKRPLNSSSPKGSGENSGSEQENVGVYITNPRFSGPWASRHSNEKTHSQGSEGASMVNISNPLAGGSNESYDKVNKGHILVTKTVEV